MPGMFRAFFMGPFPEQQYPILPAAMRWNDPVGKASVAQPWLRNRSLGVGRTHNVQYQGILRPARCFGRSIKVTCMGQGLAEPSKRTAIAPST